MSNGKHRDFIEAWMSVVESQPTWAKLGTLLFTASWRRLELKNRKKRRSGANRKHTS